MKRRQLIVSPLLSALLLWFRRIFILLPLASDEVDALETLFKGGNSGAAVSIGRVPAGPTGLTVSALGCGTWSWGNRLLWDYDPSQDEEIYSAYQTVRRAGVTVFDTADSYGTFDLNGRAEILLGQFERRYQRDLTKGEQGKEESSTSKTPWSFFNKRGSVTSVGANVGEQRQQVATKFAPYPWRITRGSVVEAARASLKRLEQDQLAIAQLHWSTSKYQPLQEGALWEGLADCHDEGLCEAVGVSNYGPRQLRKVAAKMRERNVPLATAQIQYSLMTWRVCTAMNDVVGDEDLSDVRLISYSPLCLGLLTGKYDLDNLPRPGNPRRQLFRELLPGARSLLDTVRAVATEYDRSCSQIAINWALCKDTVPIPGCRTVRQAEENIAAATFRLRPDAVQELDRSASQVKKPMIQNIFQTQ